MLSREMHEMGGNNAIGLFGTRAPFMDTRVYNAKHTSTDHARGL